MFMLNWEVMVRVGGRKNEWVKAPVGWEVLDRVGLEVVDKVDWEMIVLVVVDREHEVR